MIFDIPSVTAGGPGLVPVLTGIDILLGTAAVTLLGLVGAAALKSQRQGQLDALKQGDALRTDELFIRVGRFPERDLSRGYSYSMGEFGNEDQAHAGLSGYSLESGLVEAVSALDRRMGVSGRFTTPQGRAVPMFVTLFAGKLVGMGPDGEDLFRPSSIVGSWRTTEVRDVHDLVEKLLRAGAPALDR